MHSDRQDGAVYQNPYPSVAIIPPIQNTTSPVAMAEFDGGVGLRSNDYVFLGREGEVVVTRTNSNIGRAASARAARDLAP